MLGIYCRTSIESESSITQQKSLGIQFCVKNKFEYQVYEDEGISGYKISDDCDDPYSNRPSFTSLINDIKKGIITHVWTFELSRLSRNNFASKGPVHSGPFLISKKQLYLSKPCPQA